MSVHRKNKLKGSTVLLMLAVIQFVSMQFVFALFTSAVYVEKGELGGRMTTRMHKSQADVSRRTFLSNAAMSAAAGMLSGTHVARAQDAVDPRTDGIVAKTIGIDIHNHIDVPLTSAETPAPDLDLRGDMRRSGLSAICITFATDYQQGDAYDRFLTGLAAMDRQLRLNGIKRSLTAAEVRDAHQRGQPTVIRAVEGAHFLQGHLERVQEAYGRGLRHFGLLHDSDASVPLGDVYTNSPQFGG